MTTIQMLAAACRKPDDVVIARETLLEARAVDDRRARTEQELTY